LREKVRLQKAQIQGKEGLKTWNKWLNKRRMSLKRKLSMKGYRKVNKEKRQREIRLGKIDRKIKND